MRAQAAPRCPGGGEGVPALAGRPRGSWRSGMEITESIRRGHRAAGSAPAPGAAAALGAGPGGCQGSACSIAVFSCLCFSSTRYSAAWQSWVP